MTTSTVVSDAPDHIREIWNQVELIKKLSDRVIGIGPRGIGIDGFLAFIPGANLVYGLGAGGLLVAHAVRAEASGGTIARMLAYLAIDNATDAVPILGWAADALFPGHMMAANALQKDIEKRYGPMRDPKQKKRWWSREAVQAEPAAAADEPRKVGESSAVPGARRR